MKIFPQRILFSSVVFAMAFCAIQTHAQNTFFIFGNLRYDAAALSNASRDNYSSGFGGEGGLGIGHDKLFFTGTIGYTDFSSKESNTAGNLHYVPVKVGARYYLPLKFLFLNADAGLGFMKNKDSDVSSTKFAGDIGAGVKLGFFEVLANFDAIS